MSSPSIDQVLTGGCQCGAIRYQILSTEILSFLRCHCSECRAQSASAYGLSLYVKPEGFTFLQGNCKRWLRGTDSGGETACYFCSGCGSRVYHAAWPEAGYLSIKGGSLDDGHHLEPMADIWTDSKLPWVELLPHGYACPTEDQPFFDMLFVRWPIFNRSRIA